MRLDHLFRAEDHFFMIRLWRLIIQLKGPKYFPMFSERYGYSKPIIRFRGWRLFIFLQRKL